MFVFLLLPFIFPQNRRKTSRVVHDFVKFKMVPAAILDVMQDSHFYFFSVVLDFLVLCFKLYQNWKINSRVIQDFLKFKMAAAILDVMQTPAFTKFQ